MEGLLNAYLKPSVLVQHHIDSYNRFVDTGMKRVLSEHSLIEPSVEGFALKLGNIRIGEPSMIEADSSRRSITPNEARLRSVTYSAPIFIEVVPVIRGIEKSFH